MSLHANFVSLSSGHVDTAPSSVYKNFLKSLVHIPSRFLARLRSLDRLLDREAESNQAISFLLSYGTDSGPPVPHMATPPPSAFPHYPGPWSFFASGYAVSLFAMVRHTPSMVSNASLFARKGTALEPHTKHCRTKSPTAIASCSFHPRHTKPLGPPTHDSALDISH